MTAPNHALTGAVIGLSIGNPWLAVPLAFLSHFACDAIPHYDLPGPAGARRLNSKRFIFEFIVAGALFCFLLVVILALTRPRHWLLAAVCAFLATSPDFFWIPRFLHVKRTGKDLPPDNWFLKFHAFVQWKTGPKLFWLETGWFIVFSGLVTSYL